MFPWSLFERLELSVALRWRTFPFGARALLSMTPTEKAEAVLNGRLERLQVNLRAASSEKSRQFLAQSMVVCIGLGEAMTDYVRMIGQYAQGRYGEIKQLHAELTAQHAELLKAGTELLERLKANPDDQTLRKEIGRTQQI